MSDMHVKELLAQKMHNIWNWSDYDEIQAHNNLVCKWTHNHLAELTGLNLVVVGLNRVAVTSKCLPEVTLISDCISFWYYLGF